MQFHMANAFYITSAKLELQVMELTALLLPFKQSAFPTSEMNPPHISPYTLQNFSHQSERYFAPVILQ